MINKKTYIEIRGRNTLLLEGLDRITEYGDKRIAVRCSDCTVAVNGDRLTLAYLAESRISIEGRIDTIEYIEKQHTKSR